MLQPKLNKWYQDAETMEIFEVIDITEDAVDIQYANGLITEFSLDDWHQLHLLPAAQPEDWSMAWDLSEEDKGQAYDDEDRHKNVSLDDDLEQLVDIEDFDDELDKL